MPEPRFALGLLLLLAGCVAPTLDPLPCESCGESCEEDFLPAKTAFHRDGEIDYPDVPPAGGDHNPCWADWGVHAEEVPDENWVHNLEHGGVVFLYSCPQGCPEELLRLRDYVDTLPRGRALVTPYAELPEPYRFAAVSWEHRLLLGCFDLSALSAFFGAHVGQGREDLTADPPPECE